MESLYRIGCVNYMVLVRNSSVKYATAIVTGGILRNSVISTECVALEFSTRKTSMKSHQLRMQVQSKQGINKWRLELEEEYEDREGNIYNKKTYTELRHQENIPVTNDKDLIDIQQAREHQYGEEYTQ